MSNNPGQPPDFRALFEAAPTPFLVLNPDDGFSIIAVSDSYLRATLTTREAIIGRALFEVFPDNPDDPGATGERNLRASLLRVLVTRAPDKMPVQKYDIPRPEGGFEERYWLPQNSPVLSPEGEVAHIIHHVEDVTESVRLRREGVEQKLVEAALRDSGEWFSTTLNSIGDAVIATDSSGRVAFMNGVAVEMTGWESTEATGRSLEEVFVIVNEETREPVPNPVQKVLASGKIQGLANHTVLIAKGGDELPIDDSAAPIRDDGGRIRGVVLVFHDITEKRRAAKALAESEERYRSLFELMVEGFCVIEMILDAEGRPSDYRFLDLNPAFEGQTGLKDARGKTMRELAPDHDSHWFEIYGKVAATGEAVRFINEAKALGRWFDVSAYRVGTPDRWKVAILFIDISERMRAAAERERLAAASENDRRIYHAALSNTPDLVYVFDLQHRFIYANEALLNMWGRKLEEAIGKDCLELGYEPWHAEMHGREIDQVAATRQPIRGEVPFTGTNGPRVYEYIFTPVIAADGSVQAVAGTTRDVTERNLASERLRESEQHLRQMTEAVPQQVWTARSDGQLDYVNAQTRVYAGEIPVVDGVVQWTQVVHPEDVQRSVQLWLRSVATGDSYEVEQRVIHKESGEYRWHLSRARPVRNAEGQITKWFGTNTDIHDRKRSEAAAARARDEAQTANRMKDEFLATLSHELRTPLNAILGWAKILKMGKVDEEDLEEGIAAIERNSIAQVQIIEDLLDISRIVSGNFKLEVQRVNIQEIIEAAIATATPAATAKQIRIHKLLDSLAGPVSGDPGRIQQVIWNLVTNAVKFTPKGGKVQVLLERVNSHIEISVVDTGMGIKPEFLPHVFDRFRQADSTTTRRHGGLGLGLAIVKQLVEIHGGTVRVKSLGEGQGATFTVALPITVVHPDQPTQQKARPRDAAGHENLCKDHDLAGVKVLVLDDEADARHLIRRVLVGCEAVVAIASSAEEALRLLENFTPHVIVSDIGMPDVDGYDFIRKVRAKHPSKELPAAALTAFARAEDRKQALLAGFQTHVAKPVDPAELVAVVASLAGRTGTA